LDHRLDKDTVACDDGVVTSDTAAQHARHREKEASSQDGGHARSAARPGGSEPQHVPRGKNAKEPIHDFVKRHVKVGPSFIAFVERHAR
jgi:hypothetical protein